MWKYKITKKIFLQIASFLLLYSVGVCDNVLDENVTDNPDFGCQWSGGSLDTGVSCTCHPNAQEFFIQKGSVPQFNTVVIKIENCDAVRFGSHAISEMRNLRNLHLSNINNLYFEDSSLSWHSYIQANNDFYSTWDGTPRLKIKIEKSNVKKISSYSLQGRISSIKFEETIIEDISPFAFSSLIYNQNLEFLSVTFINIQAQAFKKFPTESLILNNSTFNEVPSRAFSDVIVSHTLQIQNCTFNKIRSAAFFITDPKRFEIINCKINLLEGEGFKVTTRGSVKIKNNTFNATNSGAFVGISLNEEVHTREEILFDSDMFTYLERKSLKINDSSFSVTYSNLFINQECSCKFAEYDLDDIEDHEQFRCFKDDEHITLKEFKDSHCSVLAGYSTIIIILGVVAGLFLIIFLSLLFYFKKIYKKNSEYLIDKNGKPISLIMPDGRTYRETELHVVVERADLLTTDL